MRRSRWWRLRRSAMAVECGAGQRISPAAVGGGGGVRGRATDLAGGGCFRRARRRCEKERGGPGRRLYEGEGPARGLEKGTGGGRRRHGLPWRRGGVAARDSVPSSGTSGAAGLGLGLARLAGPAQFGGGREERESSAGLRPRTVRRVFFNREKKKRNQI